MRGQGLSSVDDVTVLRVPRLGLSLFITVGLTVLWPFGADIKAELISFTAELAAARDVSSSP